MHAATLSGSQRLQRVKDLLSDGKAYSTMQIIHMAKVAAVSAAVAELRANGLTISCERRLNRFYYTMVP